MTARSEAAKLAEAGLTYWAPGPVSGTRWALDEAGDPVLVDAKGAVVSSGYGPGDGTPAQISAARRAAELTAAQRTPGCRVADLDGIPYGLMCPAEVQVANPLAGQMVADGPGPDGVHRWHHEPKTIAVPGYSVVPFDRVAKVRHVRGDMPERVPFEPRPDDRKYPRIADLPITVTRKGAPRG